MENLNLFLLYCLSNNFKTEAGRGNFDHGKQEGHVIKNKAERLDAQSQTWKMEESSHKPRNTRLCSVAADRGLNSSPHPLEGTQPCRHTLVLANSFTNVSDRTLTDCFFCIKTMF